MEEEGEVPVERAAPGEGGREEEGRAAHGSAAAGAVYGVKSFGMPHRIYGHTFKVLNVD